MDISLSGDWGLIISWSWVYPSISGTIWLGAILVGSFSSVANWYGPTLGISSPFSSTGIRYPFKWYVTETSTSLLSTLGPTTIFWSACTPGKTGTFTSSNFWRSNCQSLSYFPFSIRWLVTLSAVKVRNKWAVWIFFFTFVGVPS